MDTRFPLLDSTALLQKKFKVEPKVCHSVPCRPEAPTHLGVYSRPQSPKKQPGRTKRTLTSTRNSVNTSAPTTGCDNGGKKTNVYCDMGLRCGLNHGSALMHLGRPSSFRFGSLCLPSLLGRTKRAPTPQEQTDHHRPELRSIPCPPALPPAEHRKRKLHDTYALWDPPRAFPELACQLLPLPRRGSLPQQQKILLTLGR